MAEAAGAISVAEDSISLGPYLRDERRDSIRTWNMSELSDGRTIRDERYKIITGVMGTEAMYDLRNDPLETQDLLPSAAGDPVLRQRLSALETQLSQLQ